MQVMAACVALSCMVPLMNPLLFWATEAILCKQAKCGQVKKWILGCKEVIWRVYLERQADFRAIPRLVFDFVQHRERSTYQH